MAGLRAQANVVGVVLLVGVTAVALGTLTASVGTVVSDHADRAAVDRASEGLGTAIRPARTVGTRTRRVTLAGGRLHGVERQVRVSNGTDAVELNRTALVYRRGSRRVVCLGRALIRDGPGGARLVRRPHLLTTADGALLVSVGALDADLDYGGTGRVTLRLRARATHERSRLGNGTYRVAVETGTPGAWRRSFDARGLDATTRDIDGDGVPSVVVAVPEARRGYLLVHRVDVNATVVG